MKNLTIEDLTKDLQQLQQRLAPVPLVQHGHGQPRDIPHARRIGPRTHQATGARLQQDRAGVGLRGRGQVAVERRGQVHPVRRRPLWQGLHQGRQVVQNLHSLYRA